MNSVDHVEAVVCRWPDGSTVTCVVGDPLSMLGDLYFELCSPGEPKVELWFNGSTLFGEGPVDALTVKKVFGFFFDIGASRPFLASNLGLTTVTETGLGHLQIPVYVSDDLWASRYEQASELLRSGVTSDFLLWEADLFRKKGDPSTYYPRVYDEDDDQDRCDTFYLRVMDEVSFELEFDGESVEEAVDSFTDGQLVLPESEREVWEQENVLRGEWVLPLPEEVEVYRTLGEELPFWWESDRLLAWMEERSS